MFQQTWEVCAVWDSGLSGADGGELPIWSQWSYSMTGFLNSHFLCGDIYAGNTLGIPT